MRDDTAEKYGPAIRKAAVNAAIEWPDVTADDVEQEVWMRLLEAPGVTDTLEGFEPSAASRFLFKMAKQVASKEKQKARISRGDFKYSTGEVKKRLAAGALSCLGAGEMGSWAADEESSGTGNGYTDTTGATASFMADLQGALLSLKERNERYFNLIVAKYLLEEGFNHADDMAATRALKSLTNLMNFGYKKDMGEYEGPGLHKKPTRAAAQAMNHEYETSDYSGAFKEKGVW